MQIQSTTRSGAGRLVKLLAAAAIMAGAMVGQQAVAGISTTKHNLGTGGTGTNHLTAGTAEICVFCHTPHASNTAVKAPLWNKPASGATYTTYSTSTSSTIDGSVDMGGVSLACLSCHDGTQAMDTMVNAPGSGGYNAGGALLSGATWTGANQTAGKLASGVITNLTADLSNDHPVSIQYCGGGISTGSATTSSASTGSCKDTDFVAPTDALVGGARVWWVDNSVGGSSARQKTDMMLYARTGTTGDATNGWFQPWVECASCHDPHSTNATFLRISNDNSAVCLTCHSK
jgi:predicted CXXCH cytochrome family protein